MKNFLIFALFILTSLPSLSQQRTITKFEGQPIRGLIVSGAFDVRLSQGTTTLSSITVNDNLADKIIFELTDDNYIRLGFGSAVESLLKLSKNRASATIVVSQLDYLRLAGAATLIGKGSLSCSDNFVMSVTGTAFCSFLSVDCTKANLDITQAANIEDLTLNVEDNLTVEISDVAKLTLAGSASRSRVVSSNTALVNMLDFVCPDQQAIATGTSLIKAHVTHLAQVTVGGLSSFKYTGSGKVTGSGAKKL